MQPSAVRSWLAVLVIALSLGSGVPRETSADEPPADTNAITSLTPEQAAQLAAESKHIMELRLGGLKSLSPDVARALCGYGGFLNLDGLAELPIDTVKALADFKGGMLSLGGLKTLDVGTAAVLAKFRCQVLRLNGLETISDESARELAKFQGQLLWLGRLATLSPAAARSFADFKGPGLMLPGLVKADPEAAEALATFAGTLTAPTLVFGIGREPPLTPGTARLVEKFCASAHGDAVVLPNITTIDTPDAIEGLKIIVTAEWPIEMPNLKTISAKCLPILRTKQDLRIPPGDQLEIIPDGTAISGDDFAIP